MKQAYREQLKNLLPVGEAWQAEAGSNMDGVLGVFAAEFAHMHGRVASVITEALPSATQALLEDWEKAAGLPDSCTALGDTLAERKQALVQKLTQTGGQSKSFFYDLAAALGYDIEISENRPFQCGISHCGTDPLTQGEDIRHIWSVTVKQAKLLPFRLGESTLDQRLLDFRQADDLACMLGKLKPAHTELIIGYEGV